jgi:predicted flap endonuclease-1-like 5' DNA nuclease
MIENIPLEVVGGIVVAISGIALAAWRGGTFSLSNDVDGDGEDETFEADFTTKDKRDTHRLGGAEPSEQTGPTDSDGDGTAVSEDTEAESADENDTAEPSFADYDAVTDITGIGATKAEALESEVGVSAPSDVYYASDGTLTDVTGIGPSVVEQIRSDVGGVDYPASEDTE